MSITHPRQNHTHTHTHKHPHTHTLNRHTKKLDMSITHPRQNFWKVSVQIHIACKSHYIEYFRICACTTRKPWDP